MTAVAAAPAWPGSALRIGLGCMRLSTDETRDEQGALETIAAAVDAGITVFDTAHAYGWSEDELGHNERLLARALRSSGGAARARIATKGGMARPKAAWVPDGRAKTIRADCEASLEALDGLPIDLYLVHGPDPRTPWRTTLRALARLVDDGLVRHVGVANVNRPQLDQALAEAPVAAVQVGLSVLDDAPLRGGLVDRCAEAGVALIAHSPLGGPRRKRSLQRQPALAGVADALGATPAEVALAWVLDLSPGVVAIPGARTPEAARSAARAARLVLRAEDRVELAAALDVAPPRRRPPVRPTERAEVVLLMGIPGAGKTRVAAEYVERGFARLNRDERGGSLRDLAKALDDSLAAGAHAIVLDNTYLTRASRSHVVDVAVRHGASAACVWLDIPLAQAQVNLVERLLDRFGALPAPAELRRLSRTEQGVLAPTSQMRALRELEPPSRDEGFAEVRRVPFERERRARGAPGLFVARSALLADDWERVVAPLAAPTLLFDWSPSPDGRVHDLAADGARLTAAVGGPVETGLCPHGGGPPICWCRPPLPGLILAFARAQAVDPAISTLVGTSPAHRTLAETLGARHVAA